MIVEVNLTEFQDLISVLSDSTLILILLVPIVVSFLVLLGGKILKV